MSLSYKALGERAGGDITTNSGTGGAWGGAVESVVCLLHPDSAAMRTSTGRESRRMAPSPRGGHPVELGPSASTDEDRTAPAAETTAVHVKRRAGRPCSGVRRQWPS